MKYKGSNTCGIICCRVVHGPWRHVCACCKCMIVGVNKCIALCFPLTHRAWSNFHSCCLGPLATPRPGGDLIICNHTMASGVKCQTTICRFNVSIMHFAALRCQSEQQQLSTLYQLLCILPTFHHLAIIGNHSSMLVWPSRAAAGQGRAVLQRCWTGWTPRAQHALGEWVTSAIVSPPIADADFSFRISDASYQLSIGKGSILSWL